MGPIDDVTPEGRVDYQVKEIFYSVQGEGSRAGEPSVFIRFGHCNLQCNRAEHGFDCDTDFVTGLRRMTADDIVGEAKRLGGSCGWVVLTGGEPGLQVDTPLVWKLHEAGYFIAIETNGTMRLPFGIDFVCVSPKTPAETMRIHQADEVKFVLAYEQKIPPGFEGLSRKVTLISPAFAVADKASLVGRPRPGALEWCIRVVLAMQSKSAGRHQYRLSVQQQKLWKVR